MSEGATAMKRVEEHQVFAAVVGMRLNVEKLSKIAIHNGKGFDEYADCEEFIIADLAVLEEKLIKCFRITDTLIEKWESGGILFRIYLFVRSGILIGGHVFKYKLAPEDYCCDAGYETSPTQQEIRLVSRILDYISEESN